VRGKTLDTLRRNMRGGREGKLFGLKKPREDHTSRAFGVASKRRIRKRPAAARTEKGGCKAIEGKRRIKRSLLNSTRKVFSARRRVCP